MQFIDHAWGYEPCTIKSIKENGEKLGFTCKEE